MPDGIEIPHAEAQLQRFLLDVDGMLVRYVPIDGIYFPASCSLAESVASATSRISSKGIRVGDHREWHRRTRDASRVTLSC